MAFERRIQTTYDASTAGFDRGSRRVESQLTRLQRTADSRLGSIDQRFERAGRAAAKFGAAIGALAAIQGLRRLGDGIESAINKLDEIAKTSDSIGITTDALQELRVAADLAGVNSDQLDTSLKRLARTASDARNGLSTAERAFEAVGVQVTNADGSLKSLDQLVLDVADGMSGMTDATQRAATAQELFGRSGTVMVNLLKDGSEAIQEMRQQARDLGIVIDEDLIRRSEQAQDELALLNNVIDAQLTDALAELAPLLVSVVGFLGDLASAAATAHRGLRRLAGVQLDFIEVPRLTEDLTEARTELALLDEELKQIGSSGQSALATSLGFKAEPLSGDELNERLDEFAERRAAIVERIESLQRDLGTALGRGENLVPDTPDDGGGSGDSRAKANEKEKATLQDLIDTSEDRQSQLIDEAVLIRANAEEVQFLEEKQRLLNFATEKELELTPELLIEIDNLARSYANTASQVDDLRAAKELITQVEERELGTTERLRQAQERIKALLPEIIELVGDEARAHEIVAGAIEESNREIAANDPLVKLTNDLLGAIDTAEDFDDILKRILLRLIEIGAQAALSKFTTGGSSGGGILGGFIQSFVGGLFGGVGGSSTSGLTSGQIRISQLHSGGVVGRDGTSRMVPDFVFDGAPRMHDGGIAGLRPNEVPAILERGEIVVPTNIGSARASSSVTIGDTIINITEPGMTEQQLQRRLAQEREKTIRQIVEMNNRDPNILHT